MAARRIKDAKHFPPGLFSNGKKEPRGFVLSFATFALALFILLYAQLQATQLYDLRSHALEVHQKNYSARFFEDAMRDYNALLDQHLHLDQNQIVAKLTLSGRTPSPLDVSANLLRYQRDLATLGRDLNLFVFLDLNATIADGNITGRTNSGLVWKQTLDTSENMQVYSSTQNSNPLALDINLSVDLNAASHTYNNPSQTTSDFTLTLRYTDTNSGNTYSVTRTIDKNTTHTDTWLYSADDTTKTLILTIAPQGNGVRVALTHASGFTTTYALRWDFRNGATGMRAGYEIPLTVRAADSNTTSTLPWIYP